MARNPSLKGVTGGVQAGFRPKRTHGVNPPDHSRKVYVTGRKMGEQGSHFSGHFQAMRGLRNRPLRLHG